MNTAGETRVRRIVPLPGIGEWMDAIHAAAKTIEVAPERGLDPLLFPSRTDWQWRLKRTPVAGGRAVLKGDHGARGEPVSTLAHWNGGGSQ